MKSLLLIAFCLDFALGTDVASVSLNLPDDPSLPGSTISQEISQEIPSLVGSESVLGKSLYQKSVEILGKEPEQSQPHTNHDHWALQSLGRLFKRPSSTPPSVYNISLVDNNDIPLMEPTDSRQVQLEKATQMLKVSALYGNADAQMTLGRTFLFSKHGIARNSTLAFAQLSTLASNGNATAQRMVGTMYGTGIGVPRNYAKAVLYLNMAVLGGDLIAQQTLGYYHLQGIAVPKNCDEGAWYYRRVANKLYEMSRDGPGLIKRSPPEKVKIPELSGGIYGEGASGSGNPRLRQRASSSLSDSDVLTYYILQAETGDATAQLVVGQFYYSGTETIPKNYAKAMYYFKLAAKQYPGKAALKAQDVLESTKETAEAASQAMGYIGTMHFRGEGTPVDLSLARTWFERGTAMDCAACFNSLGMMHSEGLAGFSVDMTQSRHYFQEAALRDHPGGLVNLAESLMHSQNPDYVTALSFLNKAANKGNARANYHLGVIYTDGLGTPPNCRAGVQYLKTFVETANWHDGAPEKAYEAYLGHDIESSVLYYLFSAERGFESSQINAAWLMDQGLYTSSSPSRLFYTDGMWDPYEMALPLWNRAANQGNVDARVKVGDYHYYGHGIRSRPLNESDSVAFPTLEKLLLKSKPELPGTRALVPDFKKALVYYEVAAEREYSSAAMFNLAYLYEHGLGVQKDLYLAKRWYDLSFSTNPNAYLPANLALLKLYGKFVVLVMMDPLVLVQWYLPDLLPLLDLEMKGETEVLAIEDDVPLPLPVESGSDQGDIYLILGLLVLCGLLLLWRNRLTQVPPPTPLAAPIEVPPTSFPSSNVMEKKDSSTSPSSANSKGMIEESTINGDASPPCLLNEGEADNSEITPTNQNIRSMGE